MQYRGSLFERLSSYNIYGDSANEYEILYKSIANNISNILSTNSGSAETLSDYGKPDLNNIDLSQKESIETIEKSVEECIKRYEPRLKFVKVGISRTQMSYSEMYVVVEGYLTSNNQRVAFKANLIGSGKIKVLKDEN